LRTMLEGKSQEMCSFWPLPAEQEIGSGGLLLKVHILGGDGRKGVVVRMAPKRDVCSKTLGRPHEEL